MSLPLLGPGTLSPAADLAVAALIGVAFGAALERAGLGSARKLAGQFYGTDFTVFTVMFTAIVTAMVGAFIMARLGWLDMTRVAVPATWLLPQLAGGVLFGVGFVMGGLCPGTSCVAAASGKLDGVALIVGMLAGVFVFDEAFPLLRGFYDSTPRGVYTLPQLFGLGEPVVMGMVVAAAAAGFWVVGRLERRRSAG